jgi:uncharacterized coiled-coil protein SlyX
MASRAALSFLSISLLVTSPALGANTAEQSLRSSEIEATQSASRTFFAAQRAERRDAENAGLVALVDEVKALRKSVRDLRRVESELDETSATLRPAAAAATPSTAVVTTDPRRERADLDFRERRRLVREKRNALRSNLASMRTHKQSEVAAAVLRSLDAMDEELSDVLKGSRQQRRQKLRQLEDRLAARDDRLQASPEEATAPPNLTTIVRHRNPIRRKP